MHKVTTPPLTADQKRQFAKDLRKLANLEAQADTVDPAFAVEFLLELAAKYEKDADNGD